MIGLWDVSSSGLAPLCWSSVGCSLREEGGSRDDVPRNTGIVIAEEKRKAPLEVGRKEPSGQDLERRRGARSTKFINRSERDLFPSATGEVLVDRSACHRLDRAARHDFSRGHSSSKSLGLSTFWPSSSSTHRNGGRYSHPRTGEFPAWSAAAPSCVEVGVCRKIGRAQVGRRASCTYRSMR